MTKKSKIKTVLFRLLKWTAAILVILCIVIYFLIQGYKTKYCEFHRLYRDSIVNIVIYKFDPQSISHHGDSLILQSNEISSFVRKWNNSYPILSVKFMPKYTLIATLKDGQTRRFGITGDIIKERRGYCFRLPFSEHFFESIWNEKKKKASN